MTDKDKIIKELKEALDSLDITNKYRLNIIRAVEYLMDKPVSDDLEEAAKRYGTKKHPMTTIGANESAYDFKAGAKWGKNQAKVEIQAQSMALAHRCPKESVCEDLEEAMQHNAPNNIGIDDLLYWRNGFITGAKWKKEQMMKDAIAGEWFRCGIVLPSEYNSDDVKTVKITIWQDGV